MSLLSAVSDGCSYDCRLLVVVVNFELHFVLSWLWTLLAPPHPTAADLHKMSPHPSWQHRPSDLGQKMQQATPNYQVKLPFGHCLSRGVILAGCFHVAILMQSIREHPMEVRETHVSAHHVSTDYSLLLASKAYTSFCLKWLLFDKKLRNKIKTNFNTEPNRLVSG